MGYAGANPFQLTRPMRGATRRLRGRRVLRPRFQLTRPMRGATRPRPMGYAGANPFQLTRPMRGATNIIL